MKHIAQVVELAELKQSPESTKKSTSNLEERKARLFQKITTGDCPFAVPSRFKGKTFDNFQGFPDKVERLKEAILAGKSALISGPCGVGKTHLAVASMYFYYVENLKIVTDFTGEEKPEFPGKPFFLPVVDYFLELKATFGDKGPSADDVIRSYTMEKFLVLDDLGVEKSGDWTRESLYALIDSRYRSLKPTIFTTNKTLDEIAKTIDERIASRIVEMGQPFRFEGPDYRMKKEGR